MVLSAQGLRSPTPNINVRGRHYCHDTTCQRRGQVGVFTVCWYISHTTSGRGNTPSCGLPELLYTGIIRNTGTGQHRSCVATPGETAMMSRVSRQAKIADAAVTTIPDETRETAHYAKETPNLVQRVGPAVSVLCS